MFKIDNYCPIVILVNYNELNRIWILIGKQKYEQKCAANTNVHKQNENRFMENYLIDRENLSICKLGKFIGRAQSTIKFYRSDEVGRW